MYSDLIQQLQDDDTPERTVQEWMQSIILDSLQQHDDALDEIVFHGGTCLRMVHDNKRHSQDLDFHTQVDASDDWRTRDLLETIGDTIVERFNDLGVDTVDINGLHPADEADRHNISSFWVKIPGVLHESGHSNHPDEKVGVKVETDTDPPGAFTTRQAIITTHDAGAERVVATIHDDSTFIAGKIGAFLTGQLHPDGYLRSRDVYDIISWFHRYDSISINTEYLNNVLADGLSDVDVDVPAFEDAPDALDTLEDVFDATDFDHVREDTMEDLFNPREEFLLSEDQAVRAVRHARANLEADTESDDAASEASLSP